MLIGVNDDSISRDSGWTSQKDVDTFGVKKENNGNLIKITDSSNLPFQKLSVFGKTIQNKIPTPEKPVPLDSVGDKGEIKATILGKNILPPKTEEVVEVRINPDAVLVVSTRNKVPSKGGNIKAIDSNGAEIWMALDVGETEKRYTPGRKIVKIQNKFYDQSDIEYQLEVSATGKKSDFQIFNKQVLILSTPNGLPGVPVLSGGNYTDSTGQQWLCDEMDLEHGVYIQRLETVSGKKLEKVSSGTYTNRYAAYHTFSGAVSPLKGLCTHLEHAYHNNDTPHFYCDGDNIIAFLPINYPISENKNSIYFLAALETPKEIPLPPEELSAYKALHTNYPVTTVFSDENVGLKIEYIADTKSYIDKKFEELKNAILSTGGNI